MTFSPDNPFAPKAQVRPVPRPAPYSAASIDYLMQQIQQRKPEPSLITLGRAKAKGTGLEWVNPRLTLPYLRAKSGYIDLRGLPTEPPRFVADNTRAPLTQALQRWLQGR